MQSEAKSGGSLWIGNILAGTSAPPAAAAAAGAAADSAACFSGAAGSGSGADSKLSAVPHAQQLQQPPPVGHRAHAMSADGGPVCLLQLEPDPLPATLKQFADEDLKNPSDDLLMAVGSQIAFEIRCGNAPLLLYFLLRQPQFVFSAFRCVVDGSCAIFSKLGFTTSAGIAPNKMLAKIASVGSA